MEGAAGVHVEELQGQVDSELDELGEETEIGGELTLSLSRRIVEVVVDSIILRPNEGGERIEIAVAA